MPCLWNLLNPVDTERAIARRIIIFLEPRRVLYSAYEYETTHPCITSVTEIRNYLTSQLENVDENSKLNSYTSYEKFMQQISK